MPSRAILTLSFLFFVNMSFVHTANETKIFIEQNVFTIIDNLISDKFGDFVGYSTKRLAAFNDEHFGKTAVAEMINYEGIKPKLDFQSERSKFFK